jgi:putative ABC transport system substrate-binding protein
MSRFKVLRSVKCKHLCIISSSLLFATCVNAHAQAAKKVFSIGYLSPRPAIEKREEAFRDRLRALGYLEDRNIKIDWRFTKGSRALLDEFASDLVRSKVDCIVTAGVNATHAAKNATGTIPIVMADADDDPVRQGLIESLAQPGANVTGVISISSELTGKRLELLKEIVPKLSRVGIIWDPNSRPAAGHVRETTTAASELKLQIHSLELREPDHLESIFRSAGKTRMDALVTVVTGLIHSHQSRIITLAAKSRLPTMYTISEFVIGGGLISYAADIPALSRRAANYVERILKGAKPTELPVEQPTKFELIINLKTAKQIGLTIPPNVLARADKVIK